MDMTRTDAIATINDQLGGNERATAERMADALHAQHSNWNDVITAVNEMDHPTFFALADQ